MLILARKAGESIRIGEDVKLTVVRVRRNEIRLGIEAPDTIEIRMPDRDDGDEAHSAGGETEGS